MRLCFQVFVEGHKRDQYVVPLKPVVSDAIYDKSEPRGMSGRPPPPASPRGG